MGPLAEGLIVFGIAAAATLLFTLIGLAVPFVDANLQAFVAAVFILLPVAVSSRTGEDLDRFGLTSERMPRQAAFSLVPLLVVFPLFLVGFVLWTRVVCASPDWASLAPGRCARFLGWRALQDPWLGDGFLKVMEAVGVQIILVALPEELFFRGYLLERLERALPPKRRFLGGGVGWALVISAALFAVTHMIVVPAPQRLAVFFPGLLFGWMRSASGSIVPATLMHAASNLYMEALQRTFFR